MHSENNNHAKKEEVKIMLYRDYMKTHETENLSWCRPFTDNNGNYIVIYETDCMIHSKAQSINCPTEKQLSKFAKTVNPYYDDYNGYTSEEIITDAMQETGCFHCPFFHDCAAMDETWSE